jgi:hypothetical protein
MSMKIGEFECYELEEIEFAEEELSRGNTWLLRVLLARRGGLHPVPLRMCKTFQEAQQLAATILQYAENNDWDLPQDVEDVIHADEYTSAGTTDIVEFDVIVFDDVGTRVTIKPQTLVQMYYEDYEVVPLPKKS